MSETSGGVVLRFEPFELDLERAQLTKNGRRIRLAPQPFRVLALLASRGDRLVTREELREELWGGETFVDFEHGINTCIKQLRQALEDDLENPRYIVTVPKRGYRFVGRSDAEPEDGPVLASPSSSAGALWRFKWALAATMLLVAVAALLESFRSRMPRNHRLDPSFTQLTFEPGEELFPSLAPDGESFVYASMAAGNWDIYRRRVGGRVSFNLTRDSPADDWQPAFSPDGQRIAFRSERDGGGIFLMGATGESVRRLTHFGYFPTWSPDGRFIVCSTVPFGDPESLTNATSEVWAVDAANGNPRLFIEEGARQPQWSPNGYRIAFWSSSGGIRDLWTIPAEGGVPLRVTDDSSTEWNPVWSADGRHLYFSSDRAGAFNIWRVPIDETTGAMLGQPEPVTAGVGASAEWLSVSRRGREFAYVSRARRVQLRKIAFDPVNGHDAGEPVSIYEGSIRIDYPAPSPDGSLLAVQVWDQRGNIGILHADGTGLRKLTDDGFRDRLPRWSPDGKRIAFYSNRSGSYQLWWIRPDGSGLQQLTEAPEQAGYFSWSPDGTQILVRTGQSLRIFEPTTPWREQTPRDLPVANAVPNRHGEWSWDGERIAVDRVDGGMDLYVLESGEYRALVENGRACRPGWLRDGRRLLFHDESGIRLFDTRTNVQSPVFSPPAGKVGECSISFDNRVLFFTVVAPTEADVWLFTLDSGE